MVHDKVHDDTLVPLIDVPVDLESVIMIEAVNVDEALHLVRYFALETGLVLGARQSQLRRHEGDALAELTSQRGGGEH